MKALIASFWDGEHAVVSALPPAHYIHHHQPTPTKHHVWLILFSILRRFGSQFRKSKGPKSTAYLKVGSRVGPFFGRNDPNLKIFSLPAQDLEISFRPLTVESKNCKKIRKFWHCNLFFRPPALWSSQNILGPPIMVAAVFDFMDRAWPCPSSFATALSIKLFILWADLFRCASISWFQVVSKWVTCRFQLAHLRVFQSYSFEHQHYSNALQGRDPSIFLQIFIALTFSAWLCNTRPV